MGSRLRIRRVFRPLVTWIAKKFQKLNVTPNQVSVLGTIIALVGAFLFFFIHSYWGSFLFVIFVFVAGVFDGVDGTLARLTNKISIRGGYLDSNLDRYVDSIIILSFMGHYPTQTVFLGFSLLVWVLLALMGILMVSYTRARGEAAGIPNCDVGLAGRSERLFILVICALMNFAYAYFALIGLVIVVFISHMTAIYRIYYVRKNLKI
ncbi:MAG: CDP-alcohol phosphatidyltransferase family protein [Candidatus Helarchaeota archaeon]|nr:CDP-alcohol phosphatidyltransferase family protein [Candidatus Helarchaeota archaeon]